MSKTKKQADETVEVSLDLEDLTLDEAEELEQIVGANLADIEKASQPRLMKAVVFLTKRRKDPSYTIEDAGKLTMKEIQEFLVDGQGDSGNS